MNLGLPQLENYTIEYQKYWLETPETNPEDRSNHFPQNSNKNLPFIVSALAILIAILSFFT